MRESLKCDWFENLDLCHYCLKISEQESFPICKVFHETRLWPAFGRQSLVWSSFEYSYTRLASRLRRSARSLNTERKCLETAETTKSLNTERKCLETAEPTKSLNTERKCLETGKRQNPLNTESVWKQEKGKILWRRKVSRNRKMAKSFEYGKSLEIGKWQNPLCAKKSVWRGLPNDLLDV